MDTAAPSRRASGASAVPNAPAPPARPVPRAYRSSRDRVLGGVAAGLAEHLGVEVRWVRLAFVASVVFGGFGAVLYAGLWMTLPLDARFDPRAPGLAAASRQGRRQRGLARLGDSDLLVALAFVGVGLVVLVQTMLGNAFAFWPVVLGAAGVAVLWRQADEAQSERWLDSTGRVDAVRAVLGRGGPAAYARLALGGGLLVAALVLFAVQAGDVDVVRDVLLAAALGVAGLALTVGPWLFRLTSDLGEERAERIRSQERADMAAHLHDSVLQTLALIQKHADDGRTVARLARAQERDLRSWLYDEPAPAETSAASALRAAAAEVEDAHGVAVEVVTVGDVTVERGAAARLERVRPLLQAAREAMVNAAKHSGATRVDVYAEMSDPVVEIFVRDRGRGFDPDAVPADRLGVRSSILDRVRRHGGTAEVRTAPGEGTEVRLSLRVEGAAG